MDVEADSLCEVGLQCVNAVKVSNILKESKLRRDTAFDRLMDVRCDSAHVSLELSDVSTNLSLQLGDEPYAVVDTVGAEVCDVISDQTFESSDLWEVALEGAPALPLVSSATRSSITRNSQLSFKSGETYCAEVGHHFEEPAAHCMTPQISYDHPGFAHCSSCCVGLPLPIVRAGEALEEARSKVHTVWSWAKQNMNLVHDPEASLPPVTESVGLEVDLEEVFADTVHLQGRLQGLSRELAVKEGTSDMDRLAESDVLREESAVEVDEVWEEVSHADFEMGDDLFDGESVVVIDEVREDAYFSSEGTFSPGMSQEQDIEIDLDELEVEIDLDCSLEESCNGGRHEDLIMRW